MTSGIANALDLPDFFTVYLRGYCNGTYQDSASENPGSTDCSHRTALFHFNPSEMLQRYLPSGITLDDLHWPSAIEVAEGALKTFSVALSVLHIISIICVGTGVLAAAWKLCFDRRLSAMLNFAVDAVSSQVLFQVPQSDMSVNQFALVMIALATIFSTVIIRGRRDQ